MHWFKLNITLSSFSTTLQILKQNKTQLARQTIKTHSVQQHKNTPLLQYNTLNHQYIKSNGINLSSKFKQLDVYRNKLLANQALANGKDYAQYNLVKIIHICLKKVQNQKKEGNKQENKKQWEIIEQRIKQLFRNTSAIDNILLFYISWNRFSVQFQNKIVDQLQYQYKAMTPMQTQLLYYTLCNLQATNTSPLIKIINNIKSTLQSSIYKTKLPLSHLTNWIILLSITNATNMTNVLLFYEKISKYQKYILTPQQFYSLLLCLNLRSTFAQQNIMQPIKKTGYKIIELYYKKNINGDMLIAGMKQNIKIKCLLSYYHPGNKQKQLNISQITDPIFNESQIISYLYWQWKNDYLQPFQIKSLYESLTFNMLQQTKNPGFKYVDFVCYICWIQLGLNYYQNYQKVVDYLAQIQYIPKGLEWPVWNYLAQITKIKQKLQFQTQTLSKIQQIILKIKSIKQKRKKQQKLNQTAETMKKKPQIVQLSKFFHSIKAWSFNTCQTIGDVDYIVHFVNHEIKIVVHCLMESDYVQIQSGIQNSNQDKNLNPNVTSDNLNDGYEQSKHNKKYINNQSILNKKLLKQNFGYQVIQIQMNKFIQMNYNERIIWLRQKINKIRKIHGFISNQ